MARKGAAPPDPLLYPGPRSGGARTVDECQVVAASADCAVCAETPSTKALPRKPAKAVGRTRGPCPSETSSHQNSARSSGTEQYDVGDPLIDARSLAMAKIIVSRRPVRSDCVLFVAEHSSRKSSSSRRNVRADTPSSGSVRRVRRRFRPLPNATRFSRSAIHSASAAASRQPVLVHRAIERVHGLPFFIVEGSRVEVDRPLLRGAAAHAVHRASHAGPRRLRARRRWPGALQPCQGSGCILESRGRHHFVAPGSCAGQQHAKNAENISRGLKGSIRNGSG